MPKEKKKLNENEATKGRRNQGRRRRNMRREPEKKKLDVDAWKPRSEIGRKVKSGEIKDIDEILDRGQKILEPEIVDVLIPDLNTDLLLIGQSKGKFGGGQKRVFRQTQKKTREGNKPHFATCAISGNNNGYVGIGYGKSKETVPARENAMRNSKLNIIKIKRGCGSWQCGCKEPHTIPYKVTGKCGSTIIKIMPAPKGTGLAIEKECGKILKAAGIKDIWSKTHGQTKTKINLISACIDALKKLSDVKTRQEDIDALGIVEGKIVKKEIQEEVVNE
jgi:small subunit ribosomal protein S5